MIFVPIIWLAMLWYRRQDGYKEVICALLFVAMNSHHTEQSNVKQTYPILFSIMLVQGAHSFVHAPNLTYDAYLKLGDINIGAIVPIHQYSVSGLCSEQYRELGIFQRLEAIVFAIEEINNRTDILPNITLGYVILDDCYKESVAVAKALQMISTSETCAAVNTTSCSKDCSPADTYDVVGIIGSESSSTTMALGIVSTLYKIPLLSYLATSPELDSMFRFPYFFRTVPSDAQQARAIIDIILHHNWTYVSILYIDSSYGRSGYQVIREEASRKGVCWALAQQVDFRTDQGYYDDIIKRLEAHRDKARVVIIFTPLEVAQRILSAVRRANLSDVFTWISSDAWGRNEQDYEGLEDVTWGTIALKLNASSVSRFDKYFTGVSPNKQKNNPWLGDLWEELFNCSFKACNSSYRIDQSDEYKPDTLTSLVIDSVYTYAHAIDSVTKNFCPTDRNSTELSECITFDRLMEALQDVTFEGEFTRVKFDATKNGLMDYVFQNFQCHNGNYSLATVARWSPLSGLTFDKGSSIQFRKNLPAPKSVCSDPCAFGNSQEYLDSACCWTCEPCRRNEISVIEAGVMKCSACLNQTWPDEARTVCMSLTPQYLSFTDPYGATLLAIAAAGVILTFTIIIIYAINNGHKLIKASSRELSYFMLFGILMQYSGVFPMLLTPTNATCIVSFCNFPLSFCVVYAPLLIKTNRIYRIFKNGKKLKTRPKLIDSQNLLLITLLLVLVQIILEVVWVFVDTPQAITVLTAENRLDLFCSISFPALITPLSYDLLLVLACCFQAFKTRKLPTNFNESRFIAFCVYTTIIMWIIFMPAYFTSAVGYFKRFFTCLALAVSATVFLVCLFATRVYGVYFVKHGDLNVSSVGRNAVPIAIAVRAAVAMNQSAPSAARPTTSQINHGHVEREENVSSGTIETSNSELENVHIQATD